MKYGHSREIKIDFDEAVLRVKKNLSEESFGILTEINVKETLRKKIGRGYREYIILGAYNPPFVYKALQSEKEVGLLLPCNVIIYTSDDDKTIVSSVNPEIAMLMVENEKLKEIACEIGEKLRRVIDGI